MAKKRKKRAPKKRKKRARKPKSPRTVSACDIAQALGNGQALAELTCEVSDDPMSCKSGVRQAIKSTVFAIEEDLKIKLPKIVVSLDGTKRTHRTRP